MDTLPEPVMERLIPTIANRLDEIGVAIATTDVRAAYGVDGCEWFTVYIVEGGFRQKIMDLAPSTVGIWVDDDSEFIVGPMPPT